MLIPSRNGKGNTCSLRAGTSDALCSFTIDARLGKLLSNAGWLSLSFFLNVKLSLAALGFFMMVLIVSCTIDPSMAPWSDAKRGKFNGRHQHAITHIPCKAHLGFC